MFGKRRKRVVGRVAATSSESETRSAPGSGETMSYGACDSGHRAPLRYLEVRIGEYSLIGLVDTGSNRTLMGKEGINIAERLGLSVDSKNRGFV